MHEFGIKEIIFSQYFYVRFMFDVWRNSVCEVIQCELYQ